MLFPSQLPPRLKPPPSYRLYVFCAPLVRAAFAGLSECDLLHKQVTLLYNGLLCHSWCSLSPHPHTHTHTHTHTHASCWTITVMNERGRAPCDRRQLCIKPQTIRLISSSAVQWGWWRRATPAEETSTWKVLAEKTTRCDHDPQFFAGNYWVWVDNEGLVIYTDFFSSLSRLVCFSSSIHHAVCFRLFLQASLYSNTFAPLWKYCRYRLKGKLNYIF